MLLAHRRQALLTFGMAAMQLAWFTAFALILLPAVAHAPVLVAYAALLGVVLLWLLLLDALNRRHVASPQYELAVAGLVIASTLFTLRLFLYADGRPPWDLAWLGQLAATLFELTPGAGRVLAVILVNVILWQRAAAATGREVTFFAVGFSFRLGMLLLILGTGLLELVGGLEARPLLWCYFAAGLLSVALARIEDKAYNANSQGTPLPWMRLAQLLLAVGVTVALGAAAAHFFTRTAVLAVLAWLSPVWRGLEVVLAAALLVLGWLLTPVMLLLEALLRKLIASGIFDALRELAAQLAGLRVPLAAGQGTPGMHVPGWVWSALRYGLVLLVLFLLLGFVLLYLQRLGRDRRREQPEAESNEDVTLGAGLLGSTLSRLRDLAGLVRRYGLNRQLLAAVSVQNIYANVTRLARLRGYPRRPAEPPDDYLPALCRAFAGADQALARITAAYMRVHYGDRPVSFAELGALRADYHAVRRSPAREEKPGGSRG